MNLKADWVKKVTGKTNPVVVDGRNVIEPDEFIGEGFVYKGIGRGDKNDHVIA
jgi:UDP-N-acetyl-D-mannosaminuronic acid dehydrogenase